MPSGGAVHDFTDCHDVPQCMHASALFCPTSCSSGQGLVSVHGTRSQESEESGCAILPGAAAYLEAEVVSRLEAGDHWIVYAKVNSGKVGPCPHGFLLSL